MLFLYIILSISMYSLQLHKPVVNISPAEKIEVVKSKPKKSEPIILDSEETEEIDISEIEANADGVELQQTENIEDEYYDPELYEEITFQDDFDKDYREDVWDSYFDDIEENINPGSLEDSESIENILE